LTTSSVRTPSVEGELEAPAENGSESKTGGGTGSASDASSSVMSPEDGRKACQFESNTLLLVRERPTSGPLSKVLDTVSDDSHALHQGDVDRLVLVADDREEEDEPTPRAKGVPGQTDEVDCEVGNLVRLERRNVWRSAQKGRWAV
jgi:hypothetical protein